MYTCITTRPPLDRRQTPAFSRRRKTPASPFSLETRGRESSFRQASSVYLSVYWRHQCQLEEHEMHGIRTLVKGKKERNGYTGLWCNEEKNLTGLGCRV